MKEGNYRAFVVIIILLLLIAPWSSLYFPRDTYEIENDISETVETTHINDSATFVINLDSKKYHLSSCRYSDIKDEDKLDTFSDEDFLMKHGYEPCKKCIFWR